MCVCMYVYTYTYYIYYIDVYNVIYYEGKIRVI